jgi:hypothetical protein
MTRRPILIVLFFVLAAILLLAYFQTRLPPGVEAKGPSDWLPWISLAGAVISFVTGVLTLGLKVAELRKSEAPPSNK